MTTRAITFGRGQYKYERSHKKHLYDGKKMRPLCGQQSSAYSPFAFVENLEHVTCERCQRTARLMKAKVGG